mmetsp:Transcript_19563/g.41884  ORF Transcript_19563/g.41884 Transcript_19563/m.41884 type:complete len:358 (+) Transcript_19563:103-1176(+)
MATHPTPNAVALRRHRGVLVAAALLLLCFPHHSCGQEAATLAADEAMPAAAAADGDPDVVDGDAMRGGDVTDLGDVVGDAMADLTELAEDLDLDSENIAEGAGSADDVDDETAEEPAAPDAVPVADEAESDASDAEEAAGKDSETQQEESEAAAPVVQSGPYVDLLGDMLLSLEMVDEAHAQVHQHYTNEALSGKKVVGLYFSADWCGPCKQFTPDLVNFYNKMNSRRGKKDEFEIVWISRCRTVDDFGQYFTQMNWLALPPDEAMGQRGQLLGEKYKVKSIPTLVLLDEIGNVITTDGRNKIPMDKAGIGFPWRSPLSVLISTLVPRSFRLMVKTQLAGVLGLVKGILTGKKGVAT